MSKQKAPLQKSALQVKSKKLKGKIIESKSHSHFAFLFLPFSFLSAFLRGHYPEQVHRVNSQLQAGPAFCSPGLFRFF